MTYAMAGCGLGAIERCDEFYSGGLDYCIGFERSCPDGDKCCNPGGWYNQVYGQVRGAASLRYVREQKLRYAIAQLLGGAVPPDLRARVDRARAFFDAAFPPQRFVYTKDAAQGSCGTWPGHKLQTYWPSSRVQAVQALSGYTFSAAELVQLGRGGIVAPGELTSAAAAVLPASQWPVAAAPAVGDVFGAVEKVIIALPGNRYDDFRDEMPAVSDLVVGQRGMTPTPWLESFLAALTPKVAGVFPALSPTQWPIRAPVEAQEPTYSRAPAMSPALIVGGLALAAAVGIVAVRMR